MDTITKGGVIWEYLKGEVASGKEQITKADLMKVGYSAQAVENAIAEIKKDKVLNKPATPTPALSRVGAPTGAPTVPSGQGVGVLNASPAPVMGSSPSPFPQASPEEKPAELMTHPADQDLMNDLTAAIKQDAQMAPPPASAPQAISRGTIPTATHENLGASLSAIPVMSPELMHAPTIPRSVVSAPIPSPVTTMPKAPAVATVMPKRKHGFFFKFFVFIFVVLVLCGIGSGILYGMTGNWLPPVLTEQLTSLPFLSSLSEKYPKEQLFNVMLSNIGTIKTLAYTANVDVKTEPYDGKTPRPVSAMASSTNPTSPAYSASLPIGDASMHADVSGSADLSDLRSPTGLLNKNSELHGTVTGSFGGISFTSEAAFMKVDGVMYIKLNKLPTLGIFDLSKVEGKWVKFDQSAKDEFGLTETVTPEKITAQAPQAAALLNELQAKKLTATYVSSEKVGEQNSSKYKVTVDDGSEVFVWIDPQTALPVKVYFTSKTAYDANDAVMKDKMTEVAVSVTLSHINEPVTPTAPTDSISAVEAYASLTGMTVDQYYEHKQEGNVSAIFFALGNFKKVAGVFPATLNELMQTPVQIRAMYPKTAPKKSTVKTGFDFAPWADDMPVMSPVPADVFTHSQYIYATTTAKDFTLKYEIKLASSTPSSQFVNGTNTMTSKAVSVEGATAGLKKKK